MKHLTIENIVKATGGTYCGPLMDMNTTVSGVVRDSREVKPGDLFVALKGEKVDGHDYIAACYERGAAIALSERKLPEGMRYIKVESCAQALKDLAAFYRSQLKCKIVGITGSVGKTSTKEMVAAVLGMKYKVQKTKGNYNNEIGVPLTIFSIDDSHEVAVVEMGISEFGEMSRLGKMARPDMCIITNIGYCHLEYLQDRDGVLRAKTEILDYIAPGGAVILNGDDDKLVTVKEKGNPIYLYGIKNMDAYARCENIVGRGLEGMSAELILGGSRFPIEIPIAGEHNVYNAMAAACAGKLLGLTDGEIAMGIAAAKTIAGRNNVIDNGEIRVIDDCYNANPMSMKASLKVLSEIVGRKIAVLGDMGELGTTEKELHYSVGEFGAELSIDAFFCVGALSAEIHRALKEHGYVGEAFHYESKEEMLADLKGYIKKGDTVLVKASHFMNFAEIVKELG